MKLLLTLILMIMQTDTVTLFTLPELPYDLDSLEPQISGETMRYHYGKHHKAYIDNLNTLIKGTPFEGKSLEEIILGSDGAIRNNAAQAWNHTFFFLTLSPSPKKQPGGALAKAIERDFGSFETFRTLFAKQAAALFGSGWVWLTVDSDGKLRIESFSNAGNPLSEGHTPLMCMDVWEHAYYIDYRNRRADAIAAWWDKIDWGTVEKRFAAK